MKALLITAIASFFALSVSAQSATDTKPRSTSDTKVTEISTTPENTTKAATGTSAGTQRPIKVAESTTPATTTTNAGGMRVTKADKSTTVTTTKPVNATKTDAPAGNVVPASSKSRVTSTDVATPKE